MIEQAFIQDYEISSTPKVDPLKEQAKEKAALNELKLKDARKIVKQITRVQKELNELESYHIPMQQNNMQYNLCQTLFALKAFMKEHPGLDKKSLVKKWVQESDSNIRDEWFISGLLIKVRLEALYKEQIIANKQTQIRITVQSGADPTPLV